jgi:hypothetical protein
MNITTIEGTGVIRQPEGCDLLIGHLTLPASSQFESKADWDGPEVVVPEAPDLFLPEEVLYVKQHQELLEDVWDAWEGSRDRPTAVTNPMTMPQLQQQVEARLLTRKWICSGVVAGSTTAATVIGLCLWRHRRMLLIFRAHNARGRTRADNAKGDSPAIRKDEPEGRIDNKKVPDESQQTRDPGTQSGITVFQ